MKIGGLYGFYAKKHTRRTVPGNNRCRKMAIHLLGSARIPDVDGTYRSFSLPREEFVSSALKAYNNGELVSHVFHEQAIEILSDICGFQVPEKLQNPCIEIGDVLLIADITRVMRFEYRIMKRRGNPKPSLDHLKFRVLYYDRTYAILIEIAGF